MGLVQIGKHDEQQWTDTLTSLYQIAFRKFYTHTHIHTHTYTHTHTHTHEKKAMVLAV